MTFPVLPGIRPPSIGNAANGQIPADLLVNVRVHERYDVLVAQEMAAQYENLVIDCQAATGVTLGISGGGGYRTLLQQSLLFIQRYESPPVAGRPTKVWQGKTWSLKPGMATAATPGTSNHGLGSAVDVEVITTAGVGSNVYGSDAWPWLLANAVDHGLSWELQSEPWHLRLVALPAPLPPQEGDDVKQYIRVDTHPQDIYELGPPTVYISGMQGAILEAATPGWAAEAKIVHLAADVDATLPRG